MSRKFWKVGAYALGCAVLLVAGLVLRALWVIDRDYGAVAMPPIAADTSPLGVQRGELMFQSLCMECHGGRDGRATGKRLDEVPAFLGTFYSANLAHPERGVRRRSDAEIARVLRFGVLPDGRLSPVMSGFGKLGDADVAAILGYMRSGALAFEPAGFAQPPSTLTLTGAVILTYVAGMKVEGLASGVPVPRKAASVEYGRYMAQAMDCVGCHTAGFGSEKMQEPRAFAGGFELTDPTGAKIYTKNITFDAETGIGRWSLADFERAVTRGVTPDGYLVRKPMPLFSRLDHTDVAAIYAFLQTMPKIESPNKPGGHKLSKASPGDAPEQLFVNVGCAACHGKSGPHRDKLAGSLAKSDAEVAAWILDPQAIRPGSAMPSFRHALDPAQAEGLARYVREIAKQNGG